MEVRTVRLVLDLVLSVVDGVQADVVATAGRGRRREGQRVEVLDAARHVVGRWDRTVTGVRMVNWRQVHVLLAVLQLLRGALAIVKLDIYGVILVAKRIMVVFACVS